MRKTFRWFILLWVVALAAGLTARAQVESVRVVGDGELTRITIWTGEEMDAETLLWSSGTRRQILVALEGAAAASGPVQPVPAATGVTGYGW